ncbi:hypothetical protein AVEN_147628-1 [Araneus ventricosus]|uniref:Uncharacterized protein n=1 Tax=Araneus ventricosus TaxID=182803 RepID=A0A4Y2HEJ4_ARAVE|nr:hypothetical protein AVEN_147628-1 [Araneus ventricosus]
MHTRFSSPTSKHKTHHIAQLSLVISTSRSEATQGLFWDGSRNFEQRSNGDTPSPNFRTIPEGGRLMCNKPNTRRIFSGNGFRTLRPRSRDLTTIPRYASTMLEN